MVKDFDLKEPTSYCFLSKMTKKVRIFKNKYFKYIWSGRTFYINHS